MLQSFQNCELLFPLVLSRMVIGSRPISTISNISTFSTGPKISTILDYLECRFFGFFVYRKWCSDSRKRWFYMAWRHLYVCRYYFLVCDGFCWEWSSILDAPFHQMFCFHCVSLCFHLPAYRQQLLSWCIWSQHSTELPKAWSKCLHPSIVGCNPGKTAFNPAGKECVLLVNGGTLNRKCCFNVRMGWHIWRKPGPLTS